MRMNNPHAPTKDACRAASQLGRAVDRVLDDAELNPAGYRLLSFLTTGAAAGSVLAEKLAVSRPTVTSTVDWLETRGYVVRSRDASDARKVSIEITEDGIAALESADALVAKRLLDLLAYGSKEQRESILKALDHVHHILTVYRQARDTKYLSSNA